MEQDVLAARRPDSLLFQVRPLPLSNLNCHVLITDHRLTLEYARLMSMDRGAMSYAD